MIPESTQENTTTTISNRDLELPLLHSTDGSECHSYYYQDYNSSPPHTPSRCSEADSHQFRTPNGHDTNVERKYLLGFICLIIGAVCSGSVIPLVACLKANGVILKFSWRFLASVIMFMPFALRAKNLQSGKRWTFKEMFLSSASKPALITATCWVIWMATALAAALQYSFMLADLFSNITSVFILAYRLITHAPVKRGEIIGIAVALLGVGFTFVGPQESSKSMSDLATAFLVATVGALAGAIYLMVTEKMATDVPVDVFIFVNSFYGWVIVTIAAVVFEGSTFDFDETNGIFGIFAPGNLYLFPVMAIICGFCVIKMSLKAIRHLGSLIVSLFMLIAPIIAGFESWFLGLNPLPNWSSLVAAGIMSVGLIILILSQREAEDKAKVEAHYEDLEKHHSRLSC
eukprot:CAMPEP_0115046536 /NCGR_PEP_ID=MMETSP0216-20121206/48801_1 /TAXON_ID=223996 /ORGANISM="Protocruzia adherens, Strain Boccale" /LENGTH=402 /DNA_ID=CAMNT_0002429623 /DNA_START=613 /DNA_END=1821 /DNA_ORIENTATION=-